MIYTFYSYKGGVGRSMALANVAELFSQAGLKVLMVDWDLEAPGLERFFFDGVPQTILDKPGVMDLMMGYKKLMARGEKITDEQVKSGDLPFEKPDEYLIDIHPGPSKAGKLWLLTAGKRSQDNLPAYTNAVLNFDWKDFYQNWGGEVYFEWLREQFNRIADVVLIDSRTGLSEMGGVCTYQFADVVVMFCSATQQCLDGTYQMLMKLKNPDVVESRGRDIDVVVIPARIEEAESEYLETFKREFNNLFTQHIPKALGSGSDQFWRLGIPYKTRYAFKETIAVNEDNPVSQKMVEIFSQLTFALSRLVPLDSPIRKSILDTEIKIGDQIVYGSVIGGNVVISGDSNISTIVTESMNSPIRTFNEFIRTYFSHSYRSEDKIRNLFFWELFSQRGFQFTVSRRNDPSPVNISFVEWLMRRSTCFIAVISKRQDLKFHQVSQYQIFEKELASLIRKPRLLFVERGLPSHLFRDEDDAEICFYDPTWYNEPSQIQIYNEKIEALYNKVLFRCNPLVKQTESIGLLFKPDPDFYNKRIVEDINIIIQGLGFGPTKVINPISDFNTSALFTSDIESYSLLISEVRPPYIPLELNAFIQSLCIPTIRICHLEKGESEENAKKAMHLPYEMRGEKWNERIIGKWPVALSGYQLDQDMMPVIFWRTKDQLIKKLEYQLEHIARGKQNLDDMPEAKKYFLSIGRKNDKIFISNAHSHNNLAIKIYKLLSDQGIDCFHYSGDSIPVGTSNWLDITKKEIDCAGIFVTILSPDYLQSKWCEVELKHALELQKQQKIRIFPYLIHPTEYPDILQHLQARIFTNEKIDSIANIIIKDIIQCLESLDSQQDVVMNQIS